MIDELWDNTPIRLLGIRTGKLADEDEPTQLSLFDYQNPLTEKQQRLDAALDKIRKKYGNDSVLRGSLLPTENAPALSANSHVFPENPKNPF